MSNISKAIAGFVSSVVALLLALGLIQPGLAETLGEGFATAVATLAGAIITVLSVYLSPANKP